ncbi:MAG: InlB B-repeat-containing protein [Bacilli bacterium]
MINRKLLTLTLASFVLLASCNGVSETPAYNVYFFTANTAATQIETIFNQEVGTLIPRPENPTRNGFDFVAWYLDLDNTIEWDFDNDFMPNESIVLYAKWAPTIRTITYDLNDGEMINENYPTTFIPGTTFVLPQARRTGYLFRGWYLYDQILENFPNNEGTKPGDPALTTLPNTLFEDIFLYAHWQAIKAVVTFRSNHPGGASVVPNPGNRVVAYGTVIDYGTTFPSDFGTIAGYTFMGWNSRADGTGTWYPNGGIFTRTLAITLYGQWQSA